MAGHKFDRYEIKRRFRNIRGKTLGELDTLGLFESVRDIPHQKGIAGDIIEQCVLEYPPDGDQEADLLVRTGSKYYPTELKTTGLLLKSKKPFKYDAKEPMSITAVGIYDIADQTFETSHFWNKLEHLLIVYYLYLLNDSKKVTAYDYKDFPVLDYEFHHFSKEDEETLRRDWQIVHDLIAEVVSHHPGPRTEAWKAAVKQEYLDVHGVLRQNLSFIDLAPKFPPRFRLKKTTVSTMVAKHFGQEMTWISGRYVGVSDIDEKCKVITKQYGGMSVRELCKLFRIPRTDSKSILEPIVIKMFGGYASSLNSIEVFRKFGITAKTITMTTTGGRTEDMKLFPIDFDEVTREFTEDEDGGRRKICFEDSDLYTYFADNQFLCIIWEEPPKRYRTDDNGRRVEIKQRLTENRFLGFKRLVFTDEFIDQSVLPLWLDLRDKVMNQKLVDVIEMKDGQPVINKSGSISSAPNFMKASQNEVFIRGSARDSSDRYKTQVVNGIRMIPQWVWIKGTVIVDELKSVEMF